MIIQNMVVIEDWIIISQLESLFIHSVLQFVVPDKWWVEVNMVKYILDF